jgi:hypothetical protein
MAKPMMPIPKNPMVVFPGSAVGTAAAAAAQTQVQRGVTSARPCSKIWAAAPLQVPTPDAEAGRLLHLKRCAVATTWDPARLLLLAHRCAEDCLPASAFIVFRSCENIELRSL